MAGCCDVTRQAMCSQVQIYSWHERQHLGVSEGPGKAVWYPDRNANFRTELRQALLSALASRLWQCCQSSPEAGFSSGFRVFRFLSRCDVQAAVSA